MSVPAAIAIYVLFWFGSLFVVLPFGVKTPHDVGAQVEPGHADSAPVNFRFWRTVGWTTLVSALAFAVFLMNFRYGWITIDSIDLSRLRRPGEG